jgi:hypothetical protein
MRFAMTRGVRRATGAAASVLTVGVVAIALALRRELTIARRRSLPASTPAASIARAAAAATNRSSN